MESQRAITKTPVDLSSSSRIEVDLINKQWHTIPLIPEGPIFIEEIYKAQGLTAPIVEKTQKQKESIKQSRPTVKPLMKRRRLLSRAGKTPEEHKQATEKPMPVSEPSLSVLEPSLPVLEPSLPMLEQFLPVLEPSPPVSSETITLYSDNVETQSVTRLDVAHHQNCGSTSPLVTAKDNTQPIPPIQSKLMPAVPKLQSIAKLTAPPSMNANASSTCHPSTSNFSSPPPSATNVSPFTSSIFDLEPTITTGSRTTPSHSPIAKKSTTPRSVFKDRIASLKLKYNLKDLSVILYDFAKDYGNVIKFNDWNPDLSTNKNTEIGINCDKKKEKRKRKLKDSKLKQSPPDSSQKKKREVSRNCNQPIAKKVKASDSLEKPAQAKSVPKLRIALKAKLDDPIDISSVEDKPNDCNSFSDKENIMSADLESCIGSEVEPKQAWKLRESTPAPPGKKIIGVKSVTCSTEIQAEEVCKSDNVLVVRIPQTSSSIEKVDSSTEKLMDNEKSSENKAELASSSTAKLPSSTGCDRAPKSTTKPTPSSAGFVRALESTTEPPPFSAVTVLAHVAVNKLGEQTSKDDPAVTARDFNPHSTQTLTQVKDKPVISMKVYQARRNSFKSGNRSNSSSPTHPGTDSFNGSRTTSEQNSSPSSTPEDNETLISHKPKPLPTSKDSTPSPKCKGITSSNPSWHFPDGKSILKHKLVHQATSQDAPKKTKLAATIESSTPIVGNAEHTFVKSTALQTPSPIATKSSLIFASVSLEMHNRADPRRKLFLSTLAENNNNPNCVGFENSTSLAVDSTATAELDVTSGKLLPLLVMHGQRNQQPKLSLVTWNGPNAYSCLCAGTFSLYKEWAEHCRSCIKYLQ